MSSISTWGINLPGYKWYACDKRSLDRQCYLYSSPKKAGRRSFPCTWNAVNRDTLAATARISCIWNVYYISTYTIRAILALSNPKQNNKSSWYQNDSKMNLKKSLFDQSQFILRSFWCYQLTCCPVWGQTHTHAVCTYIRVQHEGSERERKREIGREK